MKKSGFIVQIIIILVALGLIGFYFGLDILKFLKNPEVQKYIIGVKNTVLLIWSYMKVGFNYVIGLFS
ncbi:MAG: hypothetical protein RJA61_459 [Candidatus Parcubacteria bacterium]|jgi:hypothetical protein